ncbi:MAG: hypothetical protein ACRCZ4_01565, partial [Plesiomonas sp.]|uniref:hypothetical protein n=1 Tax=Plesiomonas sp. TaxID=2486279 RepID=UPI003F35F019
GNDNFIGVRNIATLLTKLRRKERPMQLFAFMRCSSSDYGAAPVHSAHHNASSLYRNAPISTMQSSAAFACKVLSIGECKNGC